MTDTEVREIVSRYPEYVAAAADAFGRAMQETVVRMGRAVDLLSQTIREHPELFPLAHLPEVADPPSLAGPPPPHASD